MDNIRKQIAKILKRWVFESSYTQTKLAQEIGIAQPVLSRQLNGVETIPLSRISELAEILSPSKEDLEEMKKLLHGGVSNQEFTELTEDDHKKTITKYINSWLKKSGYSKKQIAKMLNLKHGEIKSAFEGKILIPYEKIKILINELNPPETEVTDILRHYYWKDSTPERKTNFNKKVKNVFDKINSTSFDKKLLKEIMDKHEEEVLILMENDKDRLLVELLNTWFDLSKPKKLQILTLASELETQKD